MKTVRKRAVKLRPVRLRASQSSPPPEVPTLDDPHELKIAAFGWAVEAYWIAEAEATRAYARVEEISRGGDLPNSDAQEWDRWTDLCNWRKEQAQEILVIAILIANERIENVGEFYEMPHTWPPCSFEYRNTVFVTFQEANLSKSPVLLIIDPKSQSADWMIDS